MGHAEEWMAVYKPMLDAYRSTGLTPEQITEMQTILSEKKGVEEYYTVRVALNEANGKLAKLKSEIADSERVRVVRCGECRHFNADSCSMIDYCDGCGSRVDLGFNETGFCSRGERREQE